jgi:hypothetical protein
VAGVLFLPGIPVGVAWPLDTASVRGRKILDINFVRPPPISLPAGFQEHRQAPTRHNGRAMCINEHIEAFPPRRTCVSCHNSSRAHVLHPRAWLGHMGVTLEPYVLLSDQAVTFVLLHHRYDNFKPPIVNDSCTGEPRAQWKHAVEGAVMQSQQHVLG